MLDTYTAALLALPLVGALGGYWYAQLTRRD